MRIGTGRVMVEKKGIQLSSEKLPLETKADARAKGRGMEHGTLHNRQCTVSFNNRLASGRLA